MRSVKFLVAAGAASLLSSAAFAADMPSIMPPPQPYYAPPPVQEFGGWYLRGDIGMTNTTGKLFAPAYNDITTLSVNQLGHGFTGGTSFDVGVGYQFNNWLRGDFTGEYRSRVSFSGTDVSTYSGGSTLSDVYQGGYTSWVGLVNAYVDLGTWWSLTPFVGLGGGVAHIQTTGLQDSSLAFASGVGSFGAGSYFANGAPVTNFAWAAHAGVAYKLNNNFTVEFAYRYLDMGTAVHGLGNSFDGSNAGPSSFQFRDLISQDIRFGLRWNWCDPELPPPPPLIRKG